MGAMASYGPREADDAMPVEKVAKNKITAGMR